MADMQCFLITNPVNTLMTWVIIVVGTLKESSMIDKYQ